MMELLSLPSVRMQCAIASPIDEAGMNSFRVNEYVAKFDYSIDGLGYTGDLYVIVCSPERLLAFARDELGRLYEVPQRRGR